MSDAYTRSLEAYGLEDVRPLYRRLLRRLSSHDPPAYDEAVARYHDEVESAAEDPDADPVAVWSAYGTGLAPRLAPGSRMASGREGRADPADDLPPLGTMLIHLPEDSRQRGFVLAMPSNATPAQRETAALLCE